MQGQKNRQSSDHVAPARRIVRRFLAALLLACCAGGVFADPREPENDEALGFVEAPRIVAALAQGEAAERGKGVRKNAYLAMELYCDAATMGRPEGFYRVGRILAAGPKALRNPSLANAYLALAARLGHEKAANLYDAKAENADIDRVCGRLYGLAGVQRLDLDAYVASLSAERRRIAALIRKQAPAYGVDARFALAVALVESNLNAAAVSPKNAQGVMQLIPETQERFGVRKPFDAEQNVKGGLAYLRWLQRRFSGNPALVAAAYNAGEGAVEQHGGPPPYPETQAYIRRVLSYAGVARERGRADLNL